jgi:hypothetical protein
LTDGQRTEVQARDSTTVKAGLQVIVGATSGTTTSATASSPFQPAGGTARRPGGPGGF